MPHSGEKKLFEMKLVFLEEQTQVLSSLIHTKIDKVVTSGKAWLSDSGEGEDRCSFTDIGQEVEDTVKLVTQMFKEIEGVSEEETAGEPSAKRSKLSHDWSSSSVDIKEMKSLKSWMKKMEDNIKTLTTQQTSLGNDMADLSVKQSSTEEKWMKQFNLITDKVADLNQNADVFSQQNNRKIQSLEEELQTMRNSQDELKKDIVCEIESKERLQSTLDSLQQDMGTVQVDVQKLRDAIQEQGESIQASKNDAIKMKEITDELSSLSPKIQSLESKCARPFVGFTASGRCYIPTSEIATVEWFEGDMKGNTDKSFNVQTGIFTAPFKGSYFICLRAWQLYDGNIGLKVWQTRKSSTSGGGPGRQLLFHTYTDKDNSSNSGMAVIGMDGGDTVHAEVYVKSGDVYLDYGTKLTCFLIG